jgi:hypothetical protein
LLDPNEADDTGFFKEKEPMKNRRQNFRCFTNFCLPSRCAPPKAEQKSQKMKKCSTYTHRSAVRAVPKVDQTGAFANHRATAEAPRCKEVSSSAFCRKILTD